MEIPIGLPETSPRDRDTAAKKFLNLLSKDPQPTMVDLADRIESILIDIEADAVTISTSLFDDVTVVPTPRYSPPSSGARWKTP
ncbi:hypothetical protein [Halobellus inordinatus]|uniref:hypothetical protein n=1 Tax=Halobellus inordinatus TaxID=1126236 RepID=UPI00210BADE7|nr:hypothetical protein [Halobellus inordinatus]